MSEETRRKLTDVWNYAPEVVDAITAHMRDELGPKTGWQPAGPPPVEMCEHKYTAERCIYTQCKHHPKPQSAQPSPTTEPKCDGNCDDESPPDCCSKHGCFRPGCPTPDCPHKPSPTTEAPETMPERIVAWCHPSNVSGLGPYRGWAGASLDPKHVSYTCDDVVENRVAEAVTEERVDREFLSNTLDAVREVLRAVDGELSEDAAHRVVADRDARTEDVRRFEELLHTAEEELNDFRRRFWYVQECNTRQGETVRELETALTESRAAEAHRIDQFATTLSHVEHELAERTSERNAARTALEKVERELGEARAALESKDEAIRGMSVLLAELGRQSVALNATSFELRTAYAEATKNEVKPSAEAGGVDDGNR